MFHAFLELSLISFFIGINQYSSSLEFPFSKTSSIDWSIWKFYFFIWKLIWGRLIVSFTIISRIVYTHVKLPLIEQIIDYI